MNIHSIPKQFMLLALLLGVCAALIYLPALNLGFVNWDDEDYVYQNPSMLSLNSRFVPWAFTTFHCGNWHPLTWLSLGADRLLWGIDPRGFHATNILLHGLNTSLVTILAALLIVAARKEGGGLSDVGAMTAAATTGILFGLHPIHVESVAWISERKDVLCAFFFLAGIGAYLKYAEEQPGERTGGPFYRGGAFRWYSLTLVLFLLALLSKPMAVTFPVVLLLMDWHPLGRFERERSSALLKEKIPFLALSLAASIVTIVAQRSDGSVASLNESLFTHRLLNGTHAFVMYLWKMLVPLNLIPLYPYPRDLSLLSMKYLGAFLAAAGLAASCAAGILLKRGKPWIAAWSYYLITLFPVLGFVQVGMQSMADRYAYLPSLGPFLLAGLGLALIFERKADPAARSRSERSAVLLSLGVIAIALSFLTVQQTGVWKNGFTLWSYVIEKDPQGADIAYNNRGNYYFKQGRTADAIHDFNNALKINPNFFRIYFNRAVAYNRLGEQDKTLADLTTALTLNPDFEVAYLYRAMLYNSLGRHERALADLNTALTMRPDFALGVFHRGNAHLLMRHFDKAIADYNKAIALDAEKASFYVNRGTAYHQMKRYDRAIDDFSKALSLDPNNSEGRFSRGKAHLQSGNASLAALDFEAVCNMGYPEGCKAMQAAGRRTSNKKTGAAGSSP